MIKKRKWLPARVRNLLNDAIFLARDRRLRFHADMPLFPSADVTWDTPVRDMPADDDGSAFAPGTIFAAGDSLYIQHHAPALVASLARQDLHTPLHLHQIGHAAEGLRLLEGLHKRWPFISFSHDTLDVNGSDRRARLCQCMRFDALHAFMLKAGRDVLFLDIDSIFNADPTPWWPRFRQLGDVGVLRRRRQFTLAKRYMAGCIWFQHTSATMTFLDRHVLRMRMHLRLPDLDFLDQRSLFLTLREMRGEVSTFFLSRQFVDWNGQDDCVIFTAKGAQKNSKEHSRIPCPR